jgi:DNA modification methylase
MPDKSVHCCVTSPPYFGLRDYGHAGQIGLEPTPDAFVAEMVAVFREVRRVLRDDGTLWLNLGDSYSGSGKGGNPADSPHQKQRTNAGSMTVIGNTAREAAKTKFSGEDRNFGLKPKDLIGIPWRVAFALQADGWYLRQDIIWSKPNPMPESVTDRCTKAHEYIFLMSKSARYYYDQDAIAEAVTASTIDRLSQPNLDNQIGSERVPGKTNGNMKAVGRVDKGSGDGLVDQGMYSGRAGSRADGLRNRRSVWEVVTQPFKEAHFATFPPDLIEPCIKAGCPEGRTVLDPFGGGWHNGPCSRPA